MHELAAWMKSKLAASEEAGVTSIEYALLAGFVAMMIVAGATALGLSLNAFFGSLAPHLAI